MGREYTVSEDKDTRFKPGKSGNPRGRPGRRRWYKKNWGTDDRAFVSIYVTKKQYEQLFELSKRRDESLSGCVRNILAVELDRECGKIGVNSKPIIKYVSGL